MSSVPPGAKAVDRYAVAADGSRTLEGSGSLSVQLDKEALFHLTNPPLSLSLRNFAFAWREGSCEILAGPPSSAPTYAFVIRDSDPSADIPTLVATLGAATLLSAEENEDIPEAVLFAAHAIHTTAHVAASAVHASASLVSTGMDSMFQMFKTNVRPAEKPLTLGPGSKAVVGAAAASTSAAADLSGGVRDGVGTFAQAVGNATASVITGGGARGGKMRGTTVGRSAAHLGSATLGAASTVFSAVEEGSGQVVKATTGAAAGMVGHRYGGEAQEAATAMGGSVQKAHKTFFNVASLGVRGVTRSVAKETAKGVVQQTVLPGGADRRASAMSGASAATRASAADYEEDEAAAQAQYAEEAAALPDTSELHA
mmetsp:Transcript_22600/g.61179  ORF Transcript_22600/g.61179 Transcript_22600/m.61179 type:complete len:370 (+) Transcript_22600:19-1128(+)